jgi:hypothetical protein
VNARQVLSRSSEWVLRSNALREARATIPTRGDRRDRALCQARLLLEVAQRVAEPVEGFPPGSRPAVRLGLYRQAIYWVLTASRPQDAEVPSTVAAAWAGEDPDRLRRAAHDDITLEAVKRALVEQTVPDPLDVSEQDADRVRNFAQALLGDLDAPRRRIDRMVFQRWWRISFVALLVLVAAMGLHKLTLGPNLLAGKPMRLSSSWPGCAQDAGCQSLLFHTEHETNPWAEFDLGAPKTFKRLEVANRTDCCGDRAVPLVAEVSNDRVNWREIGRKETEFSTWTVKVPATTARYLRLRVPRHTALHLKDVALR